MILDDDHFFHFSRTCVLDSAGYLVNLSVLY